MIFMLIMLSTFLWGVRRGYMQWKAQQVVVIPRHKGWRN